MVEVTRDLVDGAADRHWPVASDRRLLLLRSNQFPSCRMTSRSALCGELSYQLRPPTTLTIRPLQLVSWRDVVKSRPGPSSRRFLSTMFFFVQAARSK